MVYSLTLTDWHWADLNAPNLRKAALLVVRQGEPSLFAENWIDGTGQPILPSSRFERSYRHFDSIVVTDWTP